MEKLLTVQEAASYLRCHPMTIRKLITKKKIPHFKKEGLGIRFRKEDLDHWLESDLCPAAGWETHL